MRAGIWIVLVAASALLAACDGGGGDGTGGGASGASGGSGPGGGDTGGGGSGNNGGGTTTGGTTGSTTSSTTTTTGTEGPACGILYDDRPDCQLCMDEACCTELGSCAPGTDCDALLACASACADGDTDCVQGCIDDHATGYQDLQILNQCYADNCELEPACQYPICDSMLIYPDEECAECLGGDAACCAAFTTCAGDDTCIDCAGDPEMVGCDMNANYQAIFSCFSEGDKCGKSCTTLICDSGLGYPNAPACNFCLGQASAMGGCCEEMNACADDATCLACITGEMSGATCDNNAQLTAFNTCRTDNCAADCGG